MSASIGRKMAGPRIVLGMLLGASSMLIYLVLTSGQDVVGKFFLTLLLGLPLEASLTLLLSTFTALDEQGRLSDSSLLYKMLSMGTSRRRETIRICPSWWKLLVAFAVYNLTVLAGLFALWALVDSFRKEPVTMLLVMAGILAVVGMTLGAAILFEKKAPQKLAAKAVGPFRPTVVGKFFKALYEKTCMEIPIVREEDNKS